MAVLLSSVSCQGADPMPIETNSTTLTSGAPSTTEIAIFAGGCFWCTEAVFERMEGVLDVESGYIGGHVERPTYEQVCAKITGHAEAVRIEFDPSKTTYDDLLEVFFHTHDPTTMDRQGNDIGPQYRSVVFYLDESQQTAAKSMIAQIDEQGVYRQPIVTKVQPATTWWPAEEYHQDYFRRNPNQGYCRAVVANKVRKFNRKFGDKIKGVKRADATP
ncbi:MAG: peptide-methionine (S)-S-oxide reductase MsrA [Planctomycetota bacterium]